MTNCRKANALLSTLFISAMALTSGALAHAQLASEVVGTPEIGGVASEPSLNPDSATERPTQFALTRSGAVWEGKVVDNGDSYTIELPAGGSDRDSTRRSLYWFVATGRFRTKVKQHVWRTPMSSSNSPTGLDVVRWRLIKPLANDLRSSLTRQNATLFKESSTNSLSLKNFGQKPLAPSLSATKTASPSRPPRRAPQMNPPI